MNTEVDVIVIGASQAGLAMGYCLQKTGKSFLLIDRGKRIGDVWRSRYDSLDLFTPRAFSALPGFPLTGDPDGYPSKDEIADYLETYAEAFSIPVQLETEVKGIVKTSVGFELETSKGRYLAKQVVVAAGPFQTPMIPALSQFLSDNIFQIHSSNYVNPNQLQEGPVLIVGGGNSGAQIAVELSKERATYLSIGHSMRFLPLTIMSKSIFWWCDKLGIFRANIDSKLGKFLSKQSDPIFGLELKALLNHGTITLKPRAITVRNKKLVFADETELQVSNIVWSTGFKTDYSWIHIAGSLNEQGKPIHNRGVSPVKGLYFLGLPWQYRRGSALIGGVGDDAAYLVERIIAQGS